MGGVRVIADQVYARRGERTLALDVYRPDESGQRLPAVLYFHGGGWARGDRGAYAENRLAPLARQGVVVASASYRFSDAAPWPAQLDDARAALTHLAQETDHFGIDPDRIGTWGASAGGHIAAMLALTGGLPVHAAITWFAPADLTTLSADERPADTLWPQRIPRRPRAPGPSSEAALVGLGADEPDEADEPDDGRLRAASPLTHVRPDAPPFLILHGDRDPIVAPSQAQRLHDALIAAGAHSELVIVGGATHEDPAFERPEVLERMAAFLRAPRSVAGAQSRGG